MNKFEKVKEDLDKAMMADPNTVVIEMDFPIAKALTEYLEFIDQWERDSAKSQLVIKENNGTLEL
jgi:hypothetical protein